MFFRFVAVALFAVSCSFTFPIFAGDGVDRSTLSERETIKQIAKDMAHMNTIAASMFLAPKIADHVIAHGKQSRFNVGSPDEGVNHEIRFYTEREIYIVSVSIRSGKKSLTIDYYLTNQRFDQYIHPADSVAEELIMGAPKIIIEEYLGDQDVSGVLGWYQQFLKKRGGVFEGFTREERDKGITTGTGVKQYLLDDGKVLLKNGRWRTATTEELEDARLGYLKHLKTIAKQFGIL